MLCSRYILSALDRPIVESATIIGVVTFIISIVGVYIGNFFGNRYKKRAELAGGIIFSTNRCKDFMLNIWDG